MCTLLGCAAALLASATSAFCQEEDAAMVHWKLQPGAGKQSGDILRYEQQKLPLKC